jgi:hypothetical protein
VVGFSSLLQFLSAYPLRGEDTDTGAQQVPQKY